MTFLGSRSFSLAPSSSSNLRDFSTAFSLLGYRGGCVFFFFFYYLWRTTTIRLLLILLKKKNNMKWSIFHHICRTNFVSYLCKVKWIKSNSPQMEWHQASALSNDWSQTSGPPRHERWPTVKCAFHHLWAWLKINAMIANACVLENMRSFATVATKTREKYKSSVHWCHFFFSTWLSNA